MFARTYVNALMAALFLTALIAIPDMMIYVGIYTLGLGIPVMFAATALVYLICLLPMAICWNSANLRVASSVISVCLVAAVALIPFYNSKGEATTIAATVAQHDHIETMAGRPRSIEIAANDCQRECRHLLLSRQVDWIRIRTAIARSGGRTKFESTMYRMDTSACVSEGGDGDKAGCVVIVADGQQPAELFVGIEAHKFDNTATSGWTPQQLTRVLTIVQHNENAEVELYRRSESTIAVISPPLAILPAIKDWHSNGFEFGRMLQVFNEVSLQHGLEAIGFSFEGFKASAPGQHKRKDDKKPSPALAAAVSSVLKLDTTQPFNRQQIEIIRQWLDQMSSYVRHHRDVSFSEAEKSILRDIIDSRGIEDNIWVSHLLSLNKPLAREMIPVILTALETPGAPSFVASSATAAFRVMDTVDLAPFADRIIAIWETKSSERNRILLGDIGRLGRNPVPILGPVRDGKFVKSSILAMYCASDLQWSPQILSVMRDYMPTMRDSDRNIRDDQRALERVMDKHGGQIALKAFYAQRFPDRLKLLESRKQHKRKMSPNCQ
jgi:hypothetical protein